VSRDLDVYQLQRHVDVRDGGPMNSITIPKGDRNYDLTLHCKDKSGAIYVYNTSNVVTLKAWEPDTPSTVVVSVSCALSNATSGTITYTIQSGNWRSAMIYTAELEFTRSGNVVESLGPFQIRVAESG
jgi:hypothetical protein